MSKCNEKDTKNVTKSKDSISIGDIFYYARMLNKSGTYQVCELYIRTVEDEYFVGVDKRDKHAYLLSYDDLNKVVFQNRNKALKLVLKQEELYRKEYNL